GGGIRLLPVFCMLLIVGPVLLPALFWLVDRVASSDIGVNLGLSNPRKYLVDFYTKYDPAKLNEVDKFMKRYKGRYPEMYKKLE
ncbi:unnamed protein product, partial [Phaeothamnion confervicola]